MGAQLAERVTELESAALAPKSWTLVGEVGAGERPENSLLAEHLAFQHNAKAPPTITQDATAKLEALIVQRVKDKAWDDVERKAKPAIDPAKFRAELILDQEKSKTSLAEIYEQEFVKQSQVGLGIGEERRLPGQR